VVTVVSVGGWVVAVVLVYVVVAVVSGVVVVGAGTDVGGGGDLAGSGNRSSKVTGGHIGAACAVVFAGPATTRAATKMSAPTRADRYLPDMVGRLPVTAGVGNPADMGYVGRA
jgi:hypothetical protein